MIPSKVTSALTLGLLAVGCGTTETGPEPTDAEIPEEGYLSTNYAGMCPFGEPDEETDRQRQFRRDFIAAVNAARTAGGTCTNLGQTVTFGPLIPAAEDEDLTFATYCGLTRPNPLASSVEFQQSVVEALEVVGAPTDPPGLHSVGRVETVDAEQLVQELLVEARFGFCGIATTERYDRIGLAFGENQIIFAYAP